MLSREWGKISQRLKSRGGRMRRADVMVEILLRVTRQRSEVARRVLMHELASHGAVPEVVAHRALDPHINRKRLVLLKSEERDAIRYLIAHPVAAKQGLLGRLILHAPQLIHRQFPFIDQPRGRLQIRRTVAQAEAAQAALGGGGDGLRPRETESPKPVEGDRVAVRLAQALDHALDALDVVKGRADE